MKKIIIAIVSVLLVAYGSTDTKPEDHRVFFINSYHAGYKSSDDILEGFYKGMENKPVAVEVFYMNTKQIDSSATAEKAREAVQHIEKFQPDIVVVSDDNAVKFVVEPFLTEKSYPVLFTGVNWTSSQYNLPADKVSGILEVLPIGATVDTIQNYFPPFKTVAVLSEASTSEQKNIEVITPILKEKGLEVKYELVNDYESWKDAFVRLNKTADLIFVPTNGAIRNWKEDAAADFVQQQIRVPVITCDDFMMRYAAFGLTKLPDEMGEWAAEQALKILAGTPVDDIPISQNKKSQAWINPSLARQIGFTPGDDLQKTLITFKANE